MLRVESPDFRAFCRQVCRQTPDAPRGRMGADGVPSIRRCRHGEEDMRLPYVSQRRNPPRHVECGAGTDQHRGLNGGPRASRSAGLSHVLEELSPTRSSHQGSSQAYLVADGTLGLDSSGSGRRASRSDI